MAPRPSAALVREAEEGCPTPRVGLVQSIKVPAPRHGIGRAEAGPLLLLGLVGTLRAVEDSPAALGRWFGVSARTARTWRDQAKLERDPFGGPVLVARDGYLVRGPGFDAWLDARKPDSVNRLRTVWLPIVSMSRPGFSPVVRLVAALIRTEAMGKARRFLPSDTRRAAELGVDRATIGKARELLTASGASSFEVVLVGEGRKDPLRIRQAKRHRQKLLEPTTKFLSKNVLVRRAERVRRLRLADSLPPRRGNEPADVCGNEPAITPSGYSVTSTPSEAELGGMAFSPCGKLDGSDEGRTVTADQVTATDSAAVSGSFEDTTTDRSDEIERILAGKTEHARPDRDRRAKLKDTAKTTVRDSIRNGHAERVIAQRTAAFSKLHGPERLSQMRHAMERLLLEFGVLDKNRRQRRTLAALLVDRGADLHDLLAAALRAYFEAGRKDPASLLACRLREFTTTRDRSWISQGKVQTEDPQPRRAAQRPAAEPQPPARPAATTSGPRRLGDFGNPLASIDTAAGVTR